MPASVSLPTPVSIVEASVKSTSADSTTVSVPSPPSRLSSPARPVSKSSPASPRRELSRALPRRTSAKAVPVTLSMPVELESVRVSPDTSVCAVVAARSTLMPPLARFEKSSVSVSTSAPSTTVTLADSVPVKT